MDYSALRTLIDADDTLSGWLETGDLDETIVATLNAKTEPGFIPARHFSVALAAFPQLDGLIHFALASQQLPGVMGGGECPFALYCLLRNLDRVDKSIDKGDLMSFRSDVDAALGAAMEDPGVAALIPAGFPAKLVDGEVKRSVAEVQFGRDITGDDVRAARNLGA